MTTSHARPTRAKATKDVPATRSTDPEDAAAAQAVEVLEGAYLTAFRLLHPAATEEATAAEAVAAARQAAATMPGLPRAASKLARRVGAVYTLRGAAPRLGLTHERLRQRIVERTLVGCRTADGQWVLPVWQFEPVRGRLRVRTPVIEVWQQLPHSDGGNGWTHAAWMCTARAGLDGHTPLEWLDRHGTDARLTAATGQVRARLAA